MSQQLRSALGATHLVGIGGSGMSVIAQLLHGHGVRVSGCDRQSSAVVEELTAGGIPVAIGHAAEHLDAVDTLVISTAVRADNPDLVAARERGVRIWHRSEALAALMAQHTGVAVAGTHGKTTTTAMLAAALHGGGVDASVAIGARLAGGGVGAHVGQAPIFIAEADESDGSFLRYHPEIAIITNIEPDHLDHYQSATALRTAFSKFSGQIPPHGTLIACADDPGSAELAAATATHSKRPRVITYGEQLDADVRLEISDTQVRLVSDIPHLAGTFRLQIPGSHNALNAAAAWIAARLLGAEPRGAANGLAQFSGAERRFEVRGSARDITVVDDYAHHPTEVAAVIEAARAFLASRSQFDGRVLAVLQPHLPSRTAAFAADFAAALEHADAALVLDVFLAREEADPQISGASITCHFTPGFAGKYVPNSADLMEEIVRYAQPGDIVLLLGAGDIPLLTAGVLQGIEAGRA